MHSSRRRFIVVVIPMALAMLSTPAPIVAGTTTAAPARVQQLPPLPEWPIIGPALRSLGLIKVEPVELPEPDPTLPEYRIRDFEDLKQLEQVEEGERVRIIASDDDLNAMAAEIIETHVGDRAHLEMAFEAHEITLLAQADRALLEQSGVSLPRFGGDNLDVMARFDVNAVDCVPRVEMDKVRVNRIGLGLRRITQRAVNTRIEEVWPEELCVERVLILPDHIAAEGYYR